MTQYLTEDKIDEYINSGAAVIIDWTPFPLTEDNDDFNISLTTKEQFVVEIYVFCSDGDNESDSQWWESNFAKLAEAEGLDASNIQFVIYADDENNPNAEMCGCGEWNDEDHECENEDEDDDWN